MGPCGFRAGTGWGGELVSGGRGLVWAEVPLTVWIAGPGHLPLPWSPEPQVCQAERCPGRILSWLAGPWGACQGAPCCLCPRLPPIQLPLLRTGPL